MSIRSSKMGKRRDLSTEQKSSVIALIRNTEYSQREIAKKCGVSQSSVKRLNKKIQMNQPVTAARAGNCGRKPRQAFLDQLLQ
ncbi:hypothetical protein ANTQUA_LOCUS2996 [Anthophora quadrimaculata]